MSLFTSEHAPAIPIVSVGSPDADTTAVDNTAAAATTKKTAQCIDNVLLIVKVELYYVFHDTHVEISRDRRSIYNSKTVL
jgi:hypothetical protein